jgi:hypothetical protein
MATGNSTRLAGCHRHRRRKTRDVHLDRIAIVDPQRRLSVLFVVARCYDDVIPIPCMGEMFE